MALLHVGIRRRGELRQETKVPFRCRVKIAGVMIALWQSKSRNRLSATIKLENPGQGLLVFGAKLLESHDFIL